MGSRALQRRSRRAGTVEARSSVRRRGAPLRDRPRSAAAPTAVATRPGPSLEEIVLTTMAALAAGHPVECPVCGGPLRAAEGCSRCGSRLSD